MKTRSATFATTTLAMLLLMTPSQVSAQDPTPDLPSPSPFSQMMSGLNPMNWKLPSVKSFLPSREEKERVITKKNSLMTEVSTTAKKSWQRTKDTLNPMKLIPVGFRQNQTAEPAPEKSQPGFFSRLFSPFPQKQEPEPSVTDWLKQEPIQ